MNAISYRIIDNMEEMLYVEQLQHAIWGMSPTDILSATTMKWMTHIGGLLLGAWDKNNLVGFCIGSPGKRENQSIFWSDMTGTHPDYQGLGIGYQLKIKQRDWVREQGYSQIRWTFDPMRSGNASFNFHKLGVISYNYHPAFYGEMIDNINAGLPADRLEAIWSLEDNPIKNLKIDSAPSFIVHYDGQLIHTPSVNSTIVAIQIPLDLHQLKENNLPLAINWQRLVREAFLECFQMGYQAIDVEKNKSSCWYILYKKM